MADGNLPKLELTVYCRCPIHNVYKIGNITCTPTDKVSTAIPQLYAQAEPYLPTERTKLVLVKCGEIDLEAQLEIQDLVDTWLRRQQEVHRLVLQEGAPFSEYFPHEPSTALEWPIHIIAIDIDFLDELNTVERVAVLHTTPESWGWFKVHDPSPWCKLSRIWRGRDFMTHFEENVIDLGLSSGELAVIGMLRDTEGKMYIRDTYRGLFECIERFEYRHKKRKGLVVTGSPGIGKTTWLWFMALCSLMKHYDFLLYTAGSFLYFYGSEVYRGDPEMLSLPLHNKIKWSLIDYDKENRRALPPQSYSILPIQAAPPDHDRYRWLRNGAGYLWGMPLWTFAELFEGLKVNQDYELFMALLSQQLGESSPHAIPFEQPAVEHLRPKVQEAIRFAQNFEHLLGEEEVLGEFLSEAEKTFALAIKFAMQKFGPIVRDISRILFDGEIGALKAELTAALVQHIQPTLISLVGIGTELKLPGEYKVCCRIFSLQPNLQWRDDSNRFNSSDVFVPDYKSKAIEAIVETRIGAIDSQVLCHFYKFFENVTQTSTLLGHVLQTIAPRIMTSKISLGSYHMFQTTPQLLKRSGEPDDGSTRKKRRTIISDPNDLPAEHSSSVEPMVGVQTRSKDSKKSKLQPGSSASTSN